MQIHLSHNNLELEGRIQITGSKSESNRLLILKALYPSISIENLSNSDDTQVLHKILNSKERTLDVHHAGTAMRFLIAYFAIQKGQDITLTGSERMQERPVKLLVDALISMGAKISYLGNDGFPPLKIEGQSLQESTVQLKANISSQYISALMLIGSSLPQGITIVLEGPITSQPYIIMSLSLLKSVGIDATFEKNKISIEPVATLSPKTIYVESDWSSASYYYSIAALSKSAIIHLKNYKKNSLQGDSKLVEIYKELGVETTFNDQTITIKKVSDKKPKRLHLDLKNTPDLAQTIAVSCLGMGIGCELKGLHTLKIKETDRLVALKNEIEKFGATVIITNDSLKLEPHQILKKDVEVATYNDHRMAMAFAPLSLKIPLKINDAEVVSKSYPDFWEHLNDLKFSIKYN